MTEVTIQVHERESGKKGANRRLRREGWIPAVVYGGGKDPVPIRVEKARFLQLLREAGSENAVFLLELVGADKKRHTMIREIDSDPITHQVLHVDFQRILMDEVITVSIPIELEGTASGVKNQGGVLDFVTREVEIECLPGDIPPRVTLDVSALEIGDHLELSDIEFPGSVKLMEEPDRVVVSITAPQIEEEPEEEEEILIEAEAEEPEVIGKGKGEGEEAEDEDEG